MAKLQFYKEITSKAGAYGVATLGTRILGMAILPVCTRYMAPADYGIMDLLDIVMLLAALLLGMRWGEGMLYQYFEAPTQERRNVVISSNLIGSVLAGVVVLVLGWFCSDFLSALVFGTPKYRWYVWLMMINLSVAFPGEVSLAYFRGLNESTKCSILLVVRSVSALLLLLGLMIWFNLTVEAYLWSSIAGYLLVVTYSFAHALAAVPLRVDFRMLWEEWKYTYPLMWQAAGMMAINFGDRIFLRKSVSLDDIGIYALAYKFGLLVTMVQTPFELYWRSQAFRLLKGDNARELYVEVCTYLFLVLSTVTVGMIVCLRPVLQFVVGARFAGSMQYVPWLALAYLMKAMADYLRTVMRTENQTRHDFTVAAISTGVCLAAYSILIPAHGVWGAVISTALAFAVMLVSSYWFSQRVKHHDFEWLRMAKIAVAGTVVSVISQLVPSFGRWQDLLIATGLILLYVAIIGATQFLNEDERRLLGQGLRHIQGRVRVASTT